MKGIDGFPEITPVVKLEHERVNFGGLWHTDTAYLECPPMGTMLLAREVPPFGGDTLFANMYLAYETLSAGMRRLLDGLAAVNCSAKADVTKTREDRIRDGAKTDAKREYIAEHPVAQRSKLGPWSSIGRDCFVARGARRNDTGARRSRLALTPGPSAA